MPYVWRQGFEPSDLVGAPVQTKYGPGIVRSVVVESNDLEERIDQAAAAAAFTIAVDLLRADNQADASSSRDNADGTGASPTAEELRSTSPVTTTSPSTAAASAVAAVDQNSITTSSATVTVRVKSADEQTYPACSPGTCLLTTFGTGVLVSYRPSDGVHVVRLWRPRGAGSALGYLRRSALLRPLPAAVGIRVQTPDGDGVVVGFESGDGDDTFAVEVTTGSGGDTQTRVVHVGGDVVLSPVSKVCCSYTQFVSLASLDRGGPIRVRPASSIFHVFEIEKSTCTVVSFCANLGTLWWCLCVFENVLWTSRCDFSTNFR